jgi:hypothetical protein
VKTDTLLLHITLKHEKTKQTERHLAAHGDYSSVANCRTKIHAILQVTFGILRGTSTFLFTYSTIARATPNNVLRTRVWESAPQIMTSRLAYNCRFYVSSRSAITLNFRRP